MWFISISAISPGCLKVWDPGCFSFDLAKTGLSRRVVENANFNMGNFLKKYQQNIVTSAVRNS